MDDARRSTRGRPDVELADVTARDDASTSDDGAAASSPNAVPIAGINDDGYFGDAGGTWLPDAIVPLVLERRRAELAAELDWRRDLREFGARYGWYIAASVFCVTMLLIGAEWFGRWESGARKPRT